MTKISVSYEGELRTKCVNSENHKVIYTDAPKDNQGKGELFSPTDLLAAALGSCVLTIMGIAARKNGVSLEGTIAQVEKFMEGHPQRRIGKVKIEVHGPRISTEMQKKLEQAAHLCPVAASLHPDVKQELIFKWG